MTTRHIRSCIALALFLTACAGVTVQTEHRNKKEEIDDKGIRYYEPAPFLLIHTDSKGGLSSKIVWLPDTTQVMTIRPYSVAAKNNATFQFEGGVLTQAKSEVDQTVIPTAIVSALKASAIADASASLNTLQGTADAAVPAPLLYRIHVDENGTWTFKGGSRTPDEVKVTLVKQPKSDK